MPGLPRQPSIWFAGVFLWFAVLWILSSLSFGGPEAPPFPHIDKIQHFGYFLGGGGLLSAGLFRLNPDRPNWRRIILRTVSVMALLGAIDEWHQSFTPGRSGNDLYDWLADVTGALAGSVIFKAIHSRLKWLS